MTYKQIETMREIRLWIGQIIVPATMAVMTVMTIPEVRSAVAAKAESMKNTVENKTHKKKVIKIH